MATTGVFGLTDQQLKKFNALKRAYKDCLKANMLPVNIYGDITFYNKEMIGEYGNKDYLDQNSVKNLHPIFLNGDARTNNYFSIPSQWTDDCDHVIFLTDKGKELLDEIGE
jgi:hypothetical protein